VLRPLNWNSCMRLIRLATLALVVLGCHSAVSRGTATSPQFAPAPPNSRDHVLNPSPTTVAWGYYWSQAKPVLLIHSGDEVTIGTLLTSSPDRLAQNGVDSAAIEQSLRDVYRDVPRESRGPGGHILTGPIYVTSPESASST
jgi:hypothetical protein